VNEPFDPARGERSQPEDVWQEISRTARRRDFAGRRKSSALTGPKIAIGISGGLLALLAAIAYWRLNADGNASPDVAVAVVAAPPAAAVPIESNPPAKADAAQSVPPTIAEQSEPIISTPRSPTPVSRPVDRAPIAQADAVSSTAQIAAFEGALQQARAALVTRDVDEANRALDTAEKNLPGEDRRHEIAELRALGEQLELFLAAVRAGLQKYEATEEIQWDGNTAAVVEVGADRVALFIEGQRRDFSVSNMPADLALFFARAAADENAPQAQVFYGAFHAVDPGGDRAAARRLWQQARAADMPVDVLLPLLDQPPLGERRQPVPAGPLLEAARDQVQGQVAESILAAKSGQQKSRLAVRLLATGRAAKDSALQYAALDEAREWAISAGDPVTALAAIDALGKTFAVDVIVLKSDALGASIAGSGSTAAAAKAASAALALSDEAEQAGRLELAGTLADTAYTAARKAREGVLIRQAHQRRQALSGKR